ncbi:hypothetical protein [Pantoea agglomerans]|uniref:hypothetical protein n=1 Tax=Enterobacter agglomerans TaxID=549 RepID=UPI003C7D77AB
MTSKYSIKIDFDKTLMENPERVFEAMSFYVRGFNGLYEAFIKGFDEELIIESGLEETREGSLIADITHKITDKTKFLNIFRIWDGIFKGLENSISTIGQINTQEDIKNFSANVYQNMPANDDTICGCDASNYEIAKSLKLIYEGTQKLSTTDSTEFGINDKFCSVSKSFRFPKSVDELFDDKIIEFPSKDLLIIRRPDYVGNAQWDFLSVKRKSKPVSAKILDEAWLSKWRNHHVQFWPGDALLVDIVTKRIVKSTNGMVIFKDEIIKVLNVIHQENVEQAVMDLSNE